MFRVLVSKWNSENNLIKRARIWIKAERCEFKVLANNGKHTKWINDWKKGMLKSARG
jgi:hypothetical protein